MNKINDVTKLDKNFIAKTANFDQYDWYDIKSNALFSVNGVYFDEDEKMYIRMPRKVREKINNNVREIATYTAGGRIRFRTNSPSIAVYSTQPNTINPSRGSLMTFCGFSFYANGIFCGTTTPVSKEVCDESRTEFSYENVLHVYPDLQRQEIMYDAEIYFPLYNGVKSVIIGIKKGCKVQEAKPYKNSKPIVFYGSSITEGGCSSRPGIDYINRISRMLDTDIYNLGFAGGAKGEKEMAEFIAEVDASIYVIDYDYNAPSVEHIKDTHEPFYKIIRDKNPTTPVIFMSAPNPEYMIYGKERRDVIKSTYKNAKARGEIVDFVDGATLFGQEGREDCTVDCVHPNDVGFERMAKTIAPVLAKYLK